MKRLLLTVSLAFLFAGACGHSRGTPGDTSAAPAASTAQSARTTAPTTKPSAASERLARALLTIYDLPGGWSVSKDARGSPADTDLCAANLAALEESANALADADASFQRTGSGPYLVQSVATYPPGGSERVMTNLAGAVRGCDTVTVKDEEGQRSVWQLSPLPFPRLDDETLAFREFQSVNNVEAVIVYIRKDDLVTVLLAIAVFNRVDMVQTEAFARLAAERLRQYAASR